MNKIATTFIKIAPMLFLLNFRLRQKRKNKVTAGRKINLDNIDEVKHVNELQEEYARAVGDSDSQANDSTRALSSQLLLLTTVLLSSNIVFLSNRSTLDGLSPCQKIIVCLSVASLIYSVQQGISFGKIHMNFHQNWGTAKYEAINIISDVKHRKIDDYNVLEEKIIASTSHLSARTDDSKLNHQMMALRVTALLYFVLIIILIFNFSAFGKIFNDSLEVLF